MSMKSSDPDSQASSENKVLPKAIIDHATKPRNVGIIPNADGFGSITSDCGDNIEMWLKVKDNTIENIAFWANACGHTIACASAATELVKGKSIPQALAINEMDVSQALGGLPQENLHCAEHATKVIRAAIQDYLTLKREPWKKAYRRQ